MERDKQKKIYDNFLKHFRDAHSSLTKEKQFKEAQSR